jgi:FkbH-like protein
MRYFIFRNFTIEPLFTSFEATFSSYGDVSIFDPEADVFIWFYNIPINPEIQKQALEIDHLYGKLELLIQELPSPKDIYVFTLVNIFSFQWQNSDFDLYNKISAFNSKIIALSKIHPNVKIIDFADFVKNNSADSLMNWKYYYTSLTYINPALSEKFQKWFLKKTEAIFSKRKKCIILDLDNTLWGGVLGEDGVEGIQLGNTYPGNCYSDFQRYLVEASKSGIILAICSKNNLNDVKEAFEKNPNMILKMDNLVAYRINWNNKPTNIKELAKEINIGLDSLVFIDDNPIEREIVKKAIPEITVPEFPMKPYMITSFFRTVLNDYFQIHKLTNEDVEKTIQYKENFQRDNFKGEFTSIEDYLKNLDIELVIKKADKFTIQRIAQMTQKTNQFNLTTKRYTENDINKFIEDGDLVYCASVKDKFGDNGITLLAITTFDYKNKISVIDSYLLSCRILGRGIENVFLYFILNQIYAKGFRKVEAYYLPTTKNEQVKDFYEKNGFQVEKKEVDSIKYIMELGKELEIESYYKIIYTES